MIESLPSYWRGTVFRSRTEARWAVFFDAVGLRWEYEPEGFRIGEGLWYLPDFWLPDMQCWAEVKPDAGPTNEEATKVLGLVEGSGDDCLVLNGSPWPHPYPVATIRETPAGDEAVWVWAEFADKYIGHKGQEPHDGRPRMFWGDPATPPWDQRPGPPYVATDATSYAMALARRIDLKEPDAAHYMPLGWSGVEPVVGDAPEPLDMGDYLPWGDVIGTPFTDVDDDAA